MNLDQLQVFVTGGSGFLGKHLVTQLLAEGCLVHALVRSSDRYQGPRHPCLNLVEGDLHDDLSPYLQGISVVIHTAALVDPSCINQEKFWDINCYCTLELAKAAIKKGVSRFIFVSTSNTIGFGSADHPGYEDLSIRSPFTENAYALSKLYAEQGLLQLTDKLDLITIHPGFMIGEGAPDHGFGRMMHWVKGKSLVFYPPGGKNFVSVNDVARGIVKAMQLSKQGERFLMVNENLTYRQFFQMMASMHARKPVLIQIPASLLWLLGKAGDVFRWMGIATLLSNNHTSILSVCNFYDNAKSRSLLGMEYEPIIEVLQRVYSQVKSDDYSIKAIDVNQ